jgi:glycosyltransferase involved in cell wall biosynthesis
MKIAYIGGAYVPSREANSMHQMRMAQAFAALGHEVTLHVRPGSPGVADDFAHYGVRPSFSIVKHARPQVRVYGALVNAHHVSRYTRARPLPDLFYAREVYGLVFVAGTGVPFLFESHWKPKHAVQQGLERWLFRRPNFAGAVFISEALKRIYMRLFPWLPPDRMLVAHDAADPIASLSQAEPTSSRLQVAYVGGFLPCYGLDVLVDLAASMPGEDFHVVGGKEAELRAWRRRAGTLRNLRFYGFVPPAELGELYARFDVLLAPYQRSTAHIRWISPMKLFEYMAHGKAIVCSDFPVLREIVEHERDALLVPAEDRAAWRAAIERLRDRGLRGALGARAKEKLERDFSWRGRAERVLSLIENQP